MILALLLALSPELVLQTGHAGHRTHAVLSDDGALAVTAGADGRAILWDTRTARELRVFAHGHGLIQRVVLTGTRLITAGSDGLFRIWELASGAEVCSGNAGDDIRGAAVAGGKLITATWSLESWDLATCARDKVLAPRFGYFARLVASPDGARLASVGKKRGEGGDDRVVLWTIATGEPLQLDLKDATDVAFISDAEVVTSSETGLEVWSAEGKRLRKLENVEEPVLVRSHGTTLLVTLRGFHKGLLVDGKSGAILKTLDELGEGYGFSGDGALFLADPTDSPPRIYATATGKPTRELRGQPHTLSALAYSEKTGLFAVASPQQVELWELATGRRLLSLAVKEPMYKLSFSPDGAQLAGMGLDDALRIWETATGKELQVVPRPGKATQYGHSGLAWPAYSDGSGLGLIGGARLPGTGQVMAVRGGSVAVADFQALTLLVDGAAAWTVQTGTAIGAVAFSPDGTTLAVGYVGGPVERRSARTGELLSTARHGKFWFRTAAYSPDGLHLALAGGDEVVFVLDAATLEGQRVLAGHAGALSSALWIGNERLLSASEDGTLKLWDAVKGELLVTLAGVGANDALAVLPDGRYLGTRGAAHEVSFSLGLRSFSFDQFDVRLNRPDAVLQRIGLAPREVIDAYAHARQKRLARLGFADLAPGADFHLPELSLLSKPPPLAIPRRMLELEVRASDSAEPLDRLSVLQNGVPVRSVKLSGQKAQLKLSLALAAGDNVLELSAFNKSGTESLRETVRVRLEGELPKPVLHVLAIGAAKFQQAQFDLTYAAKDARDVAAALRKHGGRFSRVQATVLADEEVTRERVLAFRKELEASSVDDEVVIFYAGHGLLDEKLDYWLATADTSFEAPAARALAYEQLEGLLEGIPALKKLLLVDACHAGELDRDETKVASAEAGSGSGSGPGLVKSRGFQSVRKTPVLGLRSSFELMQALFADVRRGSGASVISAASGTELAYEAADWHNGVFTYALLAALPAGEGPRVSALRETVSARVLELTHGQQTPTSRRENLDLDFPLY